MTSNQETNDVLWNSWHEHPQWSLDLEQDEDGKTQYLIITPNTLVRRSVGLLLANREIMPQFDSTCFRPIKWVGRRECPKFREESFSGTRQKLLL